VVTVGHKERGARGRAWQPWWLDEAAVQSGAQVAPEEGDDRWVPHVSQARRGAKAVRGEAFSREGGGNRAGHHRRAVGWADREAKAQWGEGGGGRPIEKRRKRKKWAAVGPKVRKNSFPNNNLIFEYTKALEICRRGFRRNFDMRIFPKIF
jgi:hypothetical protein